jgi:hypothetical protein
MLLIQNIKNKIKLVCKILSDMKCFQSAVIVEYINFNDIYTSTLLFLESEKSITYIWNFTFNKLILFEDFNCMKGGFHMNEVRFYIYYINGCTIWSNYALKLAFTCNLVRFSILADITSAYYQNIIIFQSLDQKIF